MGYQWTPAALYWNKDIVLSTNNMTDTLSHTLDVQRSGVLMFERNLFKMNKNVFANKWILDQGASQGKQVPQVSTCRLLQQRLYPVCPQLRQKHWLEGGKHNAASLNLNLKPEVILEFLNKESEDLRS